MDNYEDLIKALRHCWVQNRCDECPFYATDKQTEQCAKMNTLAADAIEELTRENESLAKSVNEASEILRRRWIPVTEWLPEGEVIAVNALKGSYGYREYLIGYVGEDYESDTGFLCESDDTILTNITHWMPLPEPPKEET